MKAMFQIAFDRVISHEGDFSADKRDRGNWTTGEIGRGELKGTKFGISAMTYPHLDIPNLTLADAQRIYKQDFWLAISGDNLPPALAYQVFDSAVNHGISATIKMLQRAAGARDDGQFGPKSLKAVQSMPRGDLLARFLAERLDYMTNVTTWVVYGKGWARRIAQNLRYAAEDSSL